VRDCDEAVERGRELRADNRLLARALSRKGSALLKLAACAGDYAPAIRALQQSLAEHYSEETRAKLDEAESARKEIEERERLDREAADHHRHKGLQCFPDTSLITMLLIMAMQYIYVTVKSIAVTG
jgi:hypothetical protein